MSGCLYKCPTISGSGFETIWNELRWHYGPRTMSDSVREEKFSGDVSQFVTWANDHSKDTSDDKLFGKWLNWKLSVGSINYGNLSTRKKDHTGISCIPCPYDTAPNNVSVDSWNKRSELWLNEVPSAYEDHGSSYMRVANRGPIWGFECTYDGCPYFLNTGIRYFHS